MKYRVGSNQYRLKAASWFQRKNAGLKNGTWLNVFLGFALIGLVWAVFSTSETVHLVTPLAHAQVAGNSAELSVPTPTPTIEIENMDVWNGKYIDQFASGDSERSLWRYQFNCIEHFESTHHYTTRNGDNGLAQGLFQYHQETWVGYRKRMIKEGLITEIGSPYNDEQAIQTTAYIFAHGGQQNWSTYIEYCNQ
jgi:hypothetical protein